MVLRWPPPHYILFEPLDDKITLALWDTYKQTHMDCEYSMLDAAITHSVEEFSPWVENWMSTLPSKRVAYKVLLILHSEFLTFSCQQVLRRLLEIRAYRCRIWFHVEDPTHIQPAIISRCIVKIV